MNPRIKKQGNYKSFRLYLPKTKKNKVLTAIVIVLFIYFALPSVIYLFHPFPWGQFAIDIKGIARDINDYRREFGYYPSSIPRKNNRELKWTRPYEYRVIGDYFVITGWDGNNFWSYNSETGKFSLGRE